MSKRLRSLATVLVLGRVYVILHYVTVGSSSFTFGEEDELGFRRLSAGQITANASPLFGLPTGRETGRVEVIGPVCQALYGDAAIENTTIPVAVFSDVNCPLCRVQYFELMEMKHRKADEVKLVFHEWPIFGEGSVKAAQAILAAEAMGSKEPIQNRLMASPFSANDAYLRELSGGVGLDPDRFLAIASGHEVQRQLDQSRALAQHFVMIGTPVVIIGKTVVEGYLDITSIEQLIELEKDRRATFTC